MSIKIEEYTCSNCQLEVKAISLISYSCPNCGNILLPKEKKYQDIFESNIKEIKDEDKTIGEAIKKIPLVEIAIKNKQFDGVIEIIKNMISLITNPSTDIKVKVIIAVALLYIVSPIDIIPDLIPGLGLMDDIAMVLLAANMIGSLNDSFNTFKIRLKQKTHSNTLIYAVENDNVGREYNYSEENGKRIWKLNAGEVKKYNLKLIENSLIKAPEKYIDHPYLDKTLVPLNYADETLLKHNLEEQRNIARMLGAKTIKFSIKEDETRKRGGDVKLKVLFNNNADIDYEGESIKTQTTTHFDEYDAFDEINLKYINNFVWYYTNETPFKSIFKERLFNNVKHKELEYHFHTSNFYNSNLRANITRKNKLGVELKFSDSISRFVKIEIDFFDLPQDINNRRFEIYKNIELALEERKNEIDKNIVIIY